MKITIVISAFIIAGIIIFLTFWGGGVYPSSICLSAIAICLCAAFCVPSDKDKKSYKQVSALTLLAIISVCFLISTTIRLPMRVDGLTGERRQYQNNLVRLALNKAERLELIDDNVPYRFALSRNISGTLRVVVLAICVFTIAGITSLFPIVLKRCYLKFICILGVFIAIGGHINQWYFPEEKMIWWLFDVPHGTPVGPFISRSHFGGFMAMLAPVAFTLFVKALLKNKWIQFMLWCLAFIIISAAVVTSMCRGAVIAYSVSMLFIVPTVLIKAKGIKTTLITLLVFCICLSGIFLLPKRISSSIRSRISTLRNPLLTGSGKARLSTWRDTMRIWKDYPVCGVGANGFREVFPQYRTATTRKSFHFAENEYLQLLADHGLIGVLLVLAIVCTVSRRWYYNTKIGLPYDITVAVCGATIAVASHAVVDFALHQPLYAIVFASMLGVILSVNDKPVESIITVRIPSFFSIRLIYLFTAIIIMISLFRYGTKPYKMDSPDFLNKASPVDTCMALIGAPTGWYSWFSLGDRATRKGTLESNIFGERCVTQATEYDPNNYRLWEILGNIRFSKGDKVGADRAFARMTSLRSWKKPPDMRRNNF